MWGTGWLGGANDFPGTTEAAMQHYASIFGTSILAMMRFGDAPFLPEVPEAAKAKVMHAELPITEQVHLMASDAIEGFGGTRQIGTNFHVSLVASDRAEADRVFAALADGGKVTMPLANAPWGPYFGMCVDRFDVQWMVSLPHPV